MNAGGYLHLGLQILDHQFRYAALGLINESTKPRHAKRIKQAVCFIEGTSLELTLETFGMDLDAERLRDAFYEWVRHQTTPYSL